MPLLSLELVDMGLEQVDYSASNLVPCIDFRSFLYLHGGFSLPDSVLQRERMVCFNVACWRCRLFPPNYHIYNLIRSAGIDLPDARRRCLV